jgi:hypothetical protein
MLRKIAVVLNEGIKLRERRREEEKLPSQLSTYERLPGSRATGTEGFDRYRTKI